MRRTLKEIINNAKEYLQGDFVLEDIFWLIEETFSLERYEIISKSNELFEDHEIMEKVKKAVDVPVSYILGYQDFYSYRFNVNKNVLIPRYETEELVKHVLDYIEENKLNDVTLLDVGTGSGCIGITLDLELNKKNIKHHTYASDISKEALKVAKENNEKLKSNVQYFESNVLQNIDLKHIDILVSNPPYINKKNYVAKRVLDNEPHLALYAEEEGLEIYHQIFKDITKFNPNVTMFFEISPDLVKGLKELTNKYLPNHKIEFIKDINYNTRFAKVSLK